MPATAPFLFSLLVRHPSGAGLQGATVRILNSVGTEVTSNLLGTTPPITDASGQLAKLIQAANALPDGTYTLQVTLPGYDTWTLTTDSTFFGQGLFTAYLTLTTQAQAGDYTLLPPVANYVSSLYPILAAVDSINAASWELIRFHITHTDARTAVQEVGVDPATGLATADLHSRARLHPVPYLVPDGSASLVDPVFSDELSVTLESLTEISTVALPDTFSVGVANMVPDGESNNLEHYAGGGDGLQKWITLLAQPVVFRNYYADTMIWLPAPGSYSLITTYYDGAGATVGSPVTTSLTGNKQVRRIRLNSSPDPTVKSATLRIEQGGTILTNTLTVRYRG